MAHVYEVQTKPIYALSRFIEANPDVKYVFTRMADPRNFHSEAETSDLRTQTELGHFLCGACLRITKSGIKGEDCREITKDQIRSALKKVYNEYNRLGVKELLAKSLESSLNRYIK